MDNVGPTRTVHGGLTAVLGALMLTTAMPKGLSMGPFLWQPLCPKDCPFGLLLWHEVTVVTMVLTANGYAPRTVHGALTLTKAIPERLSIGALALA